MDISSSTQGGTVVAIPVADLAAGVYIVRLVKAGKTYTAKVLVTR